MKRREVTNQLMRSMSVHLHLNEYLVLQDVIDILLNIFDSEPSLVPERIGLIDKMQTPYTRAVFTALVNQDELKDRLFVCGKHISYKLHRMTGNNETWVLRFDRMKLADESIFQAAKILATLPLSCSFLHTASIKEVEHLKAYKLGWDEADGYTIYFREPFELGIPTLAWQTFFGSRYIRHFGKEKLLTSPAYAVQEVAPETIAIQLTKNIQDIESDWKSFHAIRQKVIRHLGPESFQQIGVGVRPTYLEDHVPFIIPASSIPEELLPLRRKADREMELLHIRENPPKAIEELEEILVNPKRFRVITYLVDKGIVERLLFDKYRSRFIRFPDAETRNRVIEAILLTGSEFHDFAKDARWGKQSKSKLPIDGPITTKSELGFDMSLLKRFEGQQAN